MGFVLKWLSPQLSQVDLTAVGRNTVDRDLQVNRLQDCPPVGHDQVMCNCSCWVQSSVPHNG